MYTLGYDSHYCTNGEVNMWMAIIEECGFRIESALRKHGLTSVEFRSVNNDVQIVGKGGTVQVRTTPIKADLSNIDKAYNEFVTTWKAVNK